MADIKKIERFATALQRLAQPQVKTTDPVTDALNAANLGPGRIGQNQQALMPVVTEMANGGVPPNKAFDIGLTISQNKKPSYTVNPPDQTVMAALSRHVSPLVQRALSMTEVGSKPWVANQWLQDLHWESE
jgi:hypothetical protein